MKTKEQIQTSNEKIRRSILVSQMQDHPGFAIFLEDQNEVLSGVQFQDIRFIKGDELDAKKGYVQAILDTKDYFEDQKRWALQPKMDEETGELEILNHKDQ